MFEAFTTLAALAQHFGEQHKKTKIQVRVVNKGTNSEFFCPMKTFYNRYYIIKDILEDIIKDFF